MTKKATEKSWQKQIPLALREVSKKGKHQCDRAEEHSTEPSKISTLLAL
jgi:hypothetical protein